MNEAKAERYRAQTRIREKNGGAGMEIKFYEPRLPDGSTKKVKRRTK